MIYTQANNPRANANRRFFLASRSEPDLSLSNPFDSTALFSLPIGRVQGIQDPMPQWYVPNWGMSVQHRLGQNTLFEVGYQGSRPKISASSKIDPFVGSEEPFWRPKF